MAGQSTRARAAAIFERAAQDIWQPLPMPSRDILALVSAAGRRERLANADPVQLCSALAFTCRQLAAAPYVRAGEAGLAVQRPRLLAARALAYALSHAPGEVRVQDAGHILGEVLRADGFFPVTKLALCRGLHAAAERIDPGGVERKAAMAAAQASAAGVPTPQQRLPQAVELNRSSSSAGKQSRP